MFNLLIDCRIDGRTARFVGSLFFGPVEGMECRVFIFMANSRNKRTQTHVITINFHLCQIARVEREREGSFMASTNLAFS